MPENDAVRVGGEAALVLALARGAKLSDAAKEAGVSESTVQRRMRDPDFRRRVQDARGDLIERTVGILATASATAAVTLVRLLSEPNAYVRLQAARSILEYAMRGHELADLQVRLLEVEDLLADSPHDREGGPHAV